MSKGHAYSRYEYPTDELSLIVFKEYKQISTDEIFPSSGIKVAVRASPNRAVIILTFDELTDVFIKVLLGGKPGLIRTCYKESNV